MVRIPGNLPALRKNKSSVSLKILMGVLAASAVAMLFALFTSDAMRDAIDSAKASFATVFAGSLGCSPV